ncbi:MAG TPA: DMT family transporter [Terracidiphilus sp.]|jgi:drug/metabolite transporter (DMT)-like permease
MSAVLPGQAKRHIAPVAALLLLCFLWSVQSLRSDLFPGLIPAAMPPIELDILSFGLLAIAAFLVGWKRKARWPRSGQIWASILIGLGLFVVPAILLSLAADRVSSFTRVALFGLAPVFAVVLEPHFDSPSGGRENSNGLAAALVALVGMLCVFPLAAPATWEAALADCAVVVAAASVAAANHWAVYLAGQGEPFAPMAALAASAAALGLAAFAISERIAWNWGASSVSLAWVSFVDLPALALLFWLMGRISAARMMTRFVIAPLMTILMGIALEQPALGLRTWIGLALMAAGACWLLSGRGHQATGITLPLNLDRG